MAIYRGFVRSLETRANGWIETTLVAVHAGNAERRFLIQSVDGDLEQVNRRLAQLGLLRDALARVLPVEVDFSAEDDFGDVIRDVKVYQRPSFEGRPGDRVIRGVVAGVEVTELDAPHGTSPYLDGADLAHITLLTADGGVERVILDLQRPERDTALAMLDLFRWGLTTRRTLEILLATGFGLDGDTVGLPAFVRSCRVPVLERADLTYVHAFVERLGQRSESWDASSPQEVDRLRLVFTTAPDQNPEGDISENGSFVARTYGATVAYDSPLVPRLEAALRDGLQVRLGLAAGDRQDPKDPKDPKDPQDGVEAFYGSAPRISGVGVKRPPAVHSVELVAPLGSAARPVWVETRCNAVPVEEPEVHCDGVPTIQNPNHRDLAAVPCSVAWSGDGWFARGVWRIVVHADGPVDVKVDGEVPCGHCQESPAIGKRERLETVAVRQVRERADAASLEEALRGAGDRLTAKGPIERCVYHAYLDGMHALDLTVHGRSCASPFRLHIHRIR
ncbi:MAG: hypothetical protein AAGM22_05215 [Acidobacteriota bacterium]